MQSQTINRTYNISYQYQLSDGENIVPLIDNQLSLMQQKYPTLDAGSWVNGFVEELYCFAQILSLDSVNPPDYDISDSDSTRLAKTLASEWGSPRFHLHLYTSNASVIQQPSDWKLVGFISLLHSSGYPYRRYRLIDLMTDNLARKIGEGGKLGFAIKNATYGLPNVKDVIVIDGTWSQELNWLQQNTTPIIVQGGAVNNVTQYTNTVTTTATITSKQLLAIQNARINGSITNNGAQAITYVLNSNATPNTYPLAANQSVALPSNYKGSVNVYTASGQATVVGTETYNA